MANETVEVPTVSKGQYSGAIYRRAVLLYITACSEQLRLYSIILSLPTTNTNE